MMTTLIRQEDLIESVADARNAGRSARAKNDELQNTALLNSLRKLAVV